jgi:hypothetical protein
MLSPANVSLKEEVFYFQRVTGIDHGVAGACIAEVRFRAEAEAPSSWKGEI